MIKLPVNPFHLWAINRIKKNKNVLIIVNGPTGGGKSYSCISLANDLAKELGTNFTVKDNLAFKFPDLLEKMKLKQNTAPGTCFVFEEVGAFGGGASAREWQSKSNKFFFSFMQTSRHRNQILFMNCPNFAFLEKGARLLVHMQLECKGIDHKKKVAYLKPFRVQVNSRTGQFYFKYLRVGYEGKTIKFNELAVKHPGKEIAAEYEKYKTKFTDELNESIVAKEEKKKEQSKVNETRLKELLEQGMRKYEIAERLGVCRQTIYAHVRKMKGK